MNVRHRIFTALLPDAVLPSALLAALSVVIPAMEAAPARAEQPRVSFDVAYLIPCREITPPEFAAANPGEMLVEAVFDISSLIRSGDEAELVQFFYQFGGCESMSVVDHLPRTELASDIAGPIQIERRGENSANIGGNASGEYPGVVKANLNVAAGSSEATTVRYELLPPQELLAASGTINRGRGVYFKLKPSARESLEGARQFVCVFRAPRTWRADLVRIDCSAVRARSLLTPSFDHAVPCGREQFQVGLYLEGDEPARCAMTSFLRARERLFSAIGENRERLEAALFANNLPGWGTMRALLASQPVERIAEELVRRRAQGELASLELPSEFVLLVDEYRAEERKLGGLTRSRFVNAGVYQSLK